MLWKIIKNMREKGFYPIFYKENILIFIAKISESFRIPPSQFMTKKLLL